MPSASIGAILYALVAKLPLTPGSWQGLPDRSVANHARICNFNILLDQQIHEHREEPQDEQPCDGRDKRAAIHALSFHVK